MTVAEDRMSKGNTEHGEGHMCLRMSCRLGSRKRQMGWLKRGRREIS